MAFIHVAVATDSAWLRRLPREVERLAEVLADRGADREADRAVDRVDFFLLMGHPRLAAVGRRLG